MTAQAGDTPTFKAALRRDLKAQRARVATAARRRAARAAALHLARQPRFRKARRVALYLEHGSELSTQPLRALCETLRIAVYVPVPRPGGAMRLVRLRAAARLRRGLYGIRVPADRTAAVTLAALDVIVLPLVGFDAHGSRLGAGGGYYDRLLARRRPGGRPWRVGYAYALQEVPRVPVESWDARLDAVVTEKGIRRCPSG